MAAKDYEGTATAAVSNFQRYYYFNPLSLRQGAASVAKIFSIAVISIAKAPFLASYDPSISLRAISTALTLKNEIHSARCMVQAIK